MIKKMKQYFSEYKMDIALALASLNGNWNVAYENYIMSTSGSLQKHISF